MRKLMCFFTVYVGLSTLLAVPNDAASLLDTPGAAKALTCSACHGNGGNSPGYTVPTIAGVAPSYFKKAIQDFADGKRPSPEMEPYAKMVLQLGVDDVAQYFASQKPRSPQAKADGAAVAQGKKASAACAACHGADGKGNPETAVPGLRGQPVGYLKNQMFLFKQEKRSPGDQQLITLKAFMKEIPDKTLEDLAAYYSSLR
jgi:cytochrome c553